MFNRIRFLLRHAALAATLISPAALRAQWTPQASGTTASFRGLSIVDDTTLWASGTRGTFVWTTDGGATWHAGQVPGAASLDLRAVHAVSIDTAYVMVSAQDTARIYKTTDRGQHWTIQYNDESKGAFLDAIAFFDSRHGLALGDPVGGRFVVLETLDGGAHWSRIPDAGLPPSLAGEGAFAASGTSLVVCGPHDVWFGTGGASASRVFRSTDSGRTWSVSETPVMAAKRSGRNLLCRLHRSARRDCGWWQLRQARPVCHHRCDHERWRKNVARRCAERGDSFSVWRRVCRRAPPRHWSGNRRNRDVT